MTTWNCVDGMDGVGGEYVSLGIIDDLKRIPDALNAMLPGPVIDDEVGSSIISTGQQRTVEREVWDSVTTRAA